MPRACSICADPRHSDVNEKLASGATVRGVATKFGLKKSSVQNHKARCLAPVLAAAARATRPHAEIMEPVNRARAIAEGATPFASDIITLAGLLDRLVRNMDRMDTAADEAAQQGMPNALAALSGQITRAVEAAGKLQGIHAPAEALEKSKFSITINMPQGF